jgi:hypothetical protein
MKLTLDKKDTVKAFRNVIKLAKVRRDTKKQMVSVEVTGDRAFLSLNGISCELKAGGVEGSGAMSLPLHFFETLVTTMRPGDFEIICDSQTAQLMQGKSLVTLRESVYREKFNVQLQQTKRVESKALRKAKKELVKCIGGADTVVYLDDQKKMRNGTLVKQFKSDGKSKALVADENRQVTEIFSDQIVRYKRSDAADSELWKAKIIIPLKFY